MKKHFYEKTSYTVFAVFAIIVIIGCFTLNNLGYMSMEISNIIIGLIGLFFIAMFIYMICCSIKDKKLSSQIQRREPKVSIELAPGMFKKPEDAIIDVDGFRYYIESPFRKEGAYPRTNDTFYSYLASFRLIKPFFKKMIKWFKKDFGLSDSPVTNDYLCYCFKDLTVADCNNPLFLFYTRNKEFRLIIAIELLVQNYVPRGLEHITALINTASAHERKNYAGSGLLDAFDLFKNGEMTPKVFKQVKSIGYCFLCKNEI